MAILFGRLNATIAVMVILVLIVFGLCLGSFVNAATWRLHEQANATQKKGKQTAAYIRRLSIAKGRSMCSQCHHELAAKDLVPVFSWLWLKGKCRYCHTAIEDSPLVEIALAVLFVASYLWWPQEFHGLGLYYFVFWLIFLVAFMALAVYDLRWYVLPNKLVFPLIILATAQVLGGIVFYHAHASDMLNSFWGVLLLAGLFYVIFQVSKGEWIGGGDVKLAVVLGILVGGPLKALLLLFIASCLGTIAGLPLILAGKRNAKIPFGPFLLGATLVVVLFGTHIIDWYQLQFIN